MSKKVNNNKPLVKNLKKYSTFSEILQFTSERVPQKIFLIQVNDLVLNDLKTTYQIYFLMYLLTFCYFCHLIVLFVEKYHHLINSTRCSNFFYFDIIYIKS